jgi:serpin B
MKKEKLSAILTLFIIALLLGEFMVQVSSNNHSQLNLQPENISIEWENGVNEKNIENVAMASDNFGLELLSKIININNNTIISPLSIWLTLAMVYEGARGDTADEMRDVLNLPENRSVARENIHWFLENFETQNENYTLKIANTLWVQQDFEIREEYEQVLKDYYNAYLKTLNFRDNPERARSIINSWVENETNGKIKNLLEKGAINTFTVAVLTNAIYFPAAWLYPFNESLTDKGYFYTPQGKELVDMMHLQATMRYTEDKDTRILELPYRGSNLSMLVVLPKGETLNLTLENLMQWRENLHPAKVKLSFPKFTLHRGYALKDALKKLGMKEVFSYKSNLTGISLKHGLFPQDVYHKVYVSVDEKGTEATAATAIPIQYRAAMPPINFVVNHPFFFIIQDRSTGAIFFMGWVANPKE